MIYKFLIAFLIFSSIQCNKQPCICDFVPTQFIEIKFLNQQNQNLIFGQYAQYQLDSILVLQQKDNFKVNNASLRKGSIDSNNVELDFYIPAAKSYLYYNQQARVDSIEITWLSKTGKCCDTPQSYNVIDSVKFNNMIIKPVNGIYYFVK